MTIFTTGFHLFSNAWFPLSGVESALWDLCGKAVGKPVVSLLGGTAHDRLTSYASGGMDSALDEVRQEARNHLARGFQAVKIRAGVSATADYAKAAAARDALGAEAALAVDAVQGSNPNPWSAAQAIECGRLLEELDLLWFKEPCAATDVNEDAECDGRSIPIAGAESTTTIAEFQRFLDADALDVAHRMPPILAACSRRARRALSPRARA